MCWSQEEPDFSARTCASACSKQGANLICVDNYFTGTRRNIESMLDYHGFEVIRHDVTFPLYLEADQIYNLT